MASAAVDAVVIGGGPAGAAAARLLAAWGHSVRLLAGTADRSHSLGESLPPSCRKLCDLLGVTAAIDGAGFLASTGNTVWWAEGEVRTAAFADGATGWQVVRHDLDALLLRLAADAGADVLDGALVRAVRLAPDHGQPGPASATVEYVTEGQRRQAVVVEASFVLDCSGRAGVVARRGFRIPDAGQTTLALTAIWTQPDGWDVDDPSHTLVETYGDGWAWSVPVTATRRYVTVMVDPRVTDSGSARALGARYEREIGKTAALRRLLDGATRDTPAWGCDASLYHAQTCGGPGVLLVGDAASFIDPLSSYGVKKALASAWLASVVVHTSLTNASLAGVALDLFNAREREMHAASVPPVDAVLRRRGGPPSAPVLDRPRDQRRHRRTGHRHRPTSTSTSFGATRRCCRRSRPCGRRPTSSSGGATSSASKARPAVTTREVVLQDRLVLPGWPPGGRGLRYLRDVDLVRLVELAPDHRQVPDLFEAYIRRCPPVSLADFLGALSVLLAKGALRFL